MSKLPNGVKKAKNRQSSVSQRGKLEEEMPRASSEADQKAELVTQARSESRVKAWRTRTPAPNPMKGEEPNEEITPKSISERSTPNPKAGMEKAQTETMCRHLRRNIAEEFSPPLAIKLYLGISITCSGPILNQEWQLKLLEAQIAAYVENFVRVEEILILWYTCCQEPLTAHVCFIN